MSDMHDNLVDPMSKVLVIYYQETLSLISHQDHRMTLNDNSNSDLVTISLCIYDDMVPPSLLEEIGLVVVEVTTLLEGYVHVAVLFGA